MVESLDRLIEDKLIPLRARVIDGLTQKHPQMFAVLNAMFSGKENKVGLQVTENGNLLGTYTFYLTGIKVTKVESGKLLSEISHPLLGVFKPYAILERSALERMLDEEQNFIEQPFSTVVKYLPHCTIKFMQ